VKIADVIVTPVAIRDAPLRNAVGLHEPYVNRIVVELVGEEGFSGFGEASFSSSTFDDLMALRPHIIGLDPLNLNAILKVVDGRLGFPNPSNFDPVFRNFDLTPRLTNHFLTRTYGPIEVAALDLSGQAMGAPVSELLGGRVRDAVPFSAYLFYKHAGGGGEGDDTCQDTYGEAMTPESIVAQARQMIDIYGFKSIKLKGGVFPPDVEIATIRALRDALGPHVPLRIDPNCAWTVDTSLEVGTQLAATLEYFEDPTPGIEGMSAVRKGLQERGIDMPLATNMCVTSFDDIPESIARNAVQVILGDHHYWGGLRSVVELGRICSTFGLGLSMHSNSHLGISLMAMTHLAAAIPAMTYDADTHYPWLHEEDEVIMGGKIQFVDGSVLVPEAPGLGIEIDREALQRGNERFQRCSYRDRDDVAYMRRTVDPNWEKLLPRW
jgi:glucarate dehydratase